MRIAILALCALGLAAPARADTRTGLDIPVAYLRHEVEPPPVLSELDRPPADLGPAGAALGLADNATTGRFLNHTYTLETLSVPPDGDALEAARTLLADTSLLVLDAPAETLLAVADLPEAQGALIFNVAAPETALRSGECRANVLHTLPSRAMRADALAQLMVARRWSRAALIAGTRPGDLAFAEALRAAVTRFGARIVAEKTWAFDADMRRAAADEVPLFTQDLAEHDLLLIADEAGDFGRYIPWNAWLPRPVAGTEGLIPAAWSPVMEQWGAEQLQARFLDAAERPMQSRDYAAWAALRTIGEAVTRTSASDPATLRAYMLGPGFALAGFKGRPLSFRPWNGQLRQPIALSGPSALVAMAPIEGFLHQSDELDTLGLDRTDSACTAFQE